MGYFGKELILSNIISPIIPNYVKMAPLLLSLFGALLAFVVYDRGLVEKGGSWYLYYVVYTFLNSG